MWNHRVMKTGPDKYGEYYYAIHEVYYDKKGRPDAATLEPITVGSDTLEGLIEVLNWMLAGAKQPVLTDDDFKPNESKNNV